jgi:hypothetical protein
MAGGDGGIPGLRCHQSLPERSRPNTYVRKRFLKTTRATERHAARLRPHHDCLRPEQVKKLNISYSDDASVFLNDRILYRGRSAQRFRDPGFLGIVNPENDAVYLALKKGQNELVLAVSELTGGWGFICRFDDMDGTH